MSQQITEHNIWSKSEYQTQKEMYQDIVNWKRQKRLEGFIVDESVEQDGQILVVAKK